MRKSDWQSTKKLKPGNVLIWQEKKFADGTIHQHLGFYLGNNKAISNSTKKGLPIIHHFTYGQTQAGQPKRKIIQILTHKIIR